MKLPAKKKKKKADSKNDNDQDLLDPSKDLFKEFVNVVKGYAAQQFSNEKERDAYYAEIDAEVSKFSSTFDDSLPGLKFNTEALPPVAITKQETEEIFETVYANLK